MLVGWYFVQDSLLSFSWKLLFAHHLGNREKSSRPGLPPDSLRMWFLALSHSHEHSRQHDNRCNGWLPEMLLLARWSLLLWGQATTQFCPPHGSQFCANPCATHFSRPLSWFRQLPRSVCGGGREVGEEGERERKGRERGLDGFKEHAVLGDEEYKKAKGLCVCNCKVRS